MSVSNNEKKVGKCKHTERWDGQFFIDILMRALLSYFDRAESNYEFGMHDSLPHSSNSPSLYIDVYVIL